MYYYRKAVLDVRRYEYSDAKIIAIIYLPFMPITMAF